MTNGTFYYVYTLESPSEQNRHHTGFTQDLRDRLQHHNRGQVPHITCYRPRRLKTYVTFSDGQRALDFERYLKSPSG